MITWTWGLTCSPILAQFFLTFLFSSYYSFQVWLQAATLFFFYFAWSEHTYNIYIYNSSTTASCFGRVAQIGCGVAQIVARRPEFESRLGAPEEALSIERKRWRQQEAVVHIAVFSSLHTFVLFVLSFPALLTLFLSSQLFTGFHVNLLAFQPFSALRPFPLFLSAFCAGILKHWRSPGIDSASLGMM